MTIQALEREELLTRLHHWQEKRRDVADLLAMETAEDCPISSYMDEMTEEIAGLDKIIQYYTLRLQGNSPEISTLLAMTLWLN